jgi:hypothetical protein
MDHHEFSDTVQAILEANNLDDKIGRQLLLAITLDTREHAYDNHCRTMQELSELREIVETQSRTIETLAAAWADHQAYHEAHPPILWLLRFRTKETIATILFIVIVPSAWYVSGIRQPILRWLGLPEF